MDVMQQANWKSMFLSLNLNKIRAVFMQLRGSSVFQKAFGYLARLKGPCVYWNGTVLN